MAKSLAYWLESPPSNTNVTLHLNFWLLNHGELAYLDIGVKFPKTGLGQAIHFYFPFQKESLTLVPSLGKTVCESDDLLSSVFNSEINITRKVKDGSKLIKFDDSKLLQFFTELPQYSEDKSVAGGLEFKAVEESGGDAGCQLTFPSSLFENVVTDGYFRFRLVLRKQALQEISRAYRASDRAFTNHFEKMEMVDFRFNEKRNLPSFVKKALSKSPSLKRVDFFLIRDASAEFKMSHADYHRCRLLEIDAWDKYLEDGRPDDVTVLPEQMLIYHWKEDKTEKEGKFIDHFAAFAKFSRWSIGKRELAAAALLVVLLGGVGSLLANTVPVQPITAFFDDAASKPKGDADSNAADVVAELKCEPVTKQQCAALEEITKSASQNPSLQATIDKTQQADDSASNSANNSRGSHNE